MSSTETTLEQLRKDLLTDYEIKLTAQLERSMTTHKNYELRDKCFTLDEFIEKYSEAA